MISVLHKFQLTNYPQFVFVGLFDQCFRVAELQIFQECATVDPRFRSPSKGQEKDPTHLQTDSRDSKGLTPTT